jgi:hypothetical protein
MKELLIQMQAVQLNRLLDLNPSEDKFRECFYIIFSDYPTDSFVRFLYKNDYINRSTVGKIALITELE